MHAHFIGGPHAGKIHPTDGKPARVLADHEGPYHEYRLVRWLDVGTELTDTAQLYYVWDALDDAAADAAILAHLQALTSD